MTITEYAKVGTKAYCESLIKECANLRDYDAIAIKGTAFEKAGTFLQVEKLSDPRISWLVIRLLNGKPFYIRFRNIYQIEKTSQKSM
jgi:hypothetical protein